MSQAAARTENVDVISKHIVKTPGMMSGRARIAGTRIRVMDVVGWRERGMTPEEIAQTWDWLTLADVYAALAYYEDNKDEVAIAFAEDEKFEQQFLEDHPEVRVITLDD